MTRGNAVLVVVAVIVALSGCATGSEEVEKMSLYKSDEAREIAHRSYDRAMDLWSVDYGEEWVETSYGTTHIIVSGPNGAKPLFLMPGLFADATMWYANAGAFSQRYRVYAVDLPVFGGKSEPSATPISSAADYAAWFGELMRHFGHERTAVAGLSYGSWLSLALAREMPGAIDAVAMLDPSESFAKMDGGIAWKGFWSFAVFPNRAKYTSFFKWLGGGYSDPEVDVWFEHMLDVIEYGSVGMFDVPQHRVYKPEELSMVRMPVLVMAGGKPILYKDPGKLAEAARRALPHAEVEIVPGTGHSLNTEKATEVNARVMRFLAENYG
jgi:pimeloyl-ACP methyl ester carboxylesterase